MIYYHRFLLLVLLLKLGNGQNQHLPDDEIVPFHLKGTMVEFPSIPALKRETFAVNNIYNESHFLHMSLRDPKRCLPRLFLERRLYNSSNIGPLEYDNFNVTENVTFFNCSSIGSRRLRNINMEQDMIVCPIFAASSEDSVLEWDLASCTMMFQLASPIRADQLRANYLPLRLPQTKSDIEKHKTSMILIIVLPGSFVLVVLFIVSLYIYRHFKKRGEDQVRLEKFLEDYKAMKPTRFSYADLKRITNHFKDKVGEGAHGTVFKGFCADGFHRALVYEFFPNGSLQKFISSPDDKENFIGWLKLQQLALGIARGIEYLHQGCDYRILHFDINPHNVLLDHNFIPKISDFGLAKLCSKNQSTVSMTAARGTLGYIAPEVYSRNFGNVSYKSDVYSYGMLLLEMVGGRKNVDTNQDTFQVLYPEWIHNLIEGGDINIYMEEDDDIRIVKKLATVGLWCIQWHPINRPSMKMVIQMLEGEVDKLKVPPTPFGTATSINTRTIIPARHLNSELEAVHELE
ncbi:rust resistance kinase Lr10-like [Neltuma alba]|uniref:rust resistance kinase Lr10-like n=1 Tax=Neltuma alba TaxID=207710 RepID=UPI0010A2E500|nr:rust resistance kinase Lr10-like [Prosopis alba]